MAFEQFSKAKRYRDFRQLLEQEEKNIDAVVVSTPDHVHNAELHVYSKGSHGFDLGTGRGTSVAIWPASFAAWLRDSNMIREIDAMKKIKGE